MSVINISIVNKGVADSIRLMQTHTPIGYTVKPEIYHLITSTVARSHFTTGNGTNFFNSVYGVRIYCIDNQEQNIIAWYSGNDLNDYIADKKAQQETTQII